MMMAKPEFAMLKALAAADGISASDYVRQFVHRAYREHLRGKAANDAGKRG
jgi:hypothetical protein